MKKYLLTIKNAPTEDISTEEVLELALSIASLENHVSFLLLEDAALLLLNTEFNLLNRNLLAKTIEAFKLFNFDHIYVENVMLDQIKLANLNVAAEYKHRIKTFNWKELNLLYNNHDIILIF